MHPRAFEAYNNQFNVPQLTGELTPCAINEGNDHGVDFEHLGVYDAVSCCFDNYPNMQGCKTMKTHIMLQSPSLFYGYF